MADQAEWGQARPSGVFGWALRPVTEGSCAGCGVELRSAYQLRRLTSHGWSDVTDQKRCLRCWSTFGLMSWAVERPAHAEKQTADSEQ